MPSRLKSALFQCPRTRSRILLVPHRPRGQFESARAKNGQNGASRPRKRAAGPLGPHLAACTRRQDPDRAPRAWNRFPPRKAPPRAAERRPRRRRSRRCADCRFWSPGTAKICPTARAEPDRARPERARKSGAQSCGQRGPRPRERTGAMVRSRTTRPRPSSGGATPALPGTREVQNIRYRTRARVPSSC